LRVRWIGLLLLGIAFLALSGSRGGIAGTAPRSAGQQAPPPRHAARAAGREVTERASELDHHSAFYSRAACEAALAARPRAARHAPRLGTWNVRWFPTGTKDGHDPAKLTDVAWLACAIATLEVDLLAVQEFVQNPGGRAALLDLLERLDALTGGRWHAELDDCGGSGRQHLGFLFDQTRVELKQFGPIAALNPGASACDRSLRPGFFGYARFREGPDLSVVTMHLDSGTTTRDFANRRRSVARLGSVAAELARRTHDRDLVVLGDLNSMGCKDCQPELEAASEVAGLDAELHPIGLRRVPLTEHSACTEYQRGHASLLDHGIVPVAMEELAPGARLEVFGPCRELMCKAPPRGQHPEALDRLSDHCPLVMQLTAEDRDPGIPLPGGPRKP
jgi:endonuclease/exonuclease/phosphatase family metal-dependent hydrolase